MCYDTDNYAEDCKKIESSVIAYIIQDRFELRNI